jgi:hypothetical protein
MLLVSANLAPAQSMIGIYFLPAFFAEAEVEAAVAEVEVTAAPPADEVVDMDTTPDPSSTPAIQPLPTPDPCTDDKIEEKERTTTPEPHVVSSDLVVATTEDASTTEEETETLARDSDEVAVEKPESSDVESLSKPAVKSDVVEDETKVAQEEKEEEVLLV